MDNPALGTCRMRNVRDSQFCSLLNIICVTYKRPCNTKDANASYRSNIFGTTEEQTQR